MAVELPGILSQSLQASALILLILGVRALVRNRWSARWQASLWVVLLASMIVPWRPPASRTLVVAVPAALSRHPVAGEVPRAAVDAAGEPKAARPRMPLPSPRTVWLAGMLILALRLAQVNLRLWMAVRRGRVLTSQRVLDLLEVCKEAMGVRTLVGIVLTDRVPGPALFGFIRPRLLLPPALVEGLSDEELRFVLLHELAHLKRLDIHVGWLCAALQLLHWFNPLVWIAFHQMRGDRELACDEEVLARLSSPESPRYGRTLIKLLEPVPPTLLPSLAGVSENAAHFKRRIQMIAAAPRRHWTLAPSLAFAAVALCALGVRMHAEDAPGKPIVDRIDYPFVTDPQVLGGWRSVDFVAEPADFDPAARQWKQDLFLKELFVRPGGKTNWAWSWTKGLFLHPGEHTASAYEVRNLAGKDYLFFQWKSGDYVHLHRKPRWYVLVRDERLVTPETRVEDRVDYPFVDDPEVHGAWVAVDFVRTPEAFDPARIGPAGDFFLSRIEFLDGGKTRFGFRENRISEKSTWTRGLVLSAADKTASAYQIRRMDGATYLFFEWKSGDYTFRAQRPQYYVLRRAI
ncbi:M56 family metallopeptidase [Geothrix sp. 21YS21S-2]|uniref:M56 family metallopeptidase n=1 Tax=Geothrix sp. 21YS21S-2 TaxID=3068893 RepID=UPI0027B9402B|nr:M56 family metallopeptidase [Geothrix sp. 21YS21S-2]